MEIGDVNGLRYHLTMTIGDVNGYGYCFLVMLSERKMFGDVNG